MKKLLGISSLFGGYAISFLTIWAWTTIDASAVLFWSLVGAFAWTGIVMYIAEEIEESEKAKRKARRKC